MMKQFLRVKQIADQKFQRGSEKGRGVLSNELHAAEKRVDLIRESCAATGKKLSACMLRIGPEQAGDRRNPKKIPEAALAQCMEEWGLSLGENSILGMTLVDFARIQETLAIDLLSYKLQVEENVVEPLQNILSVDVEKIIKLRKQLSKLTSEMDSAKTRYQSAQRSSMQANSNGAAATKAQLLKEETEDILSRVDQCRDSLTAEMFNLISREPEMSQVFVKLCQLQLEHHRKAFCMLESVLPELEAQISSCAYQPVFGVHLSDHLRLSKREIAIVIESCICWILESAIEEEGLFRIGGSMIKIKKIKSAFDAGFHHLLEEERDPHNVAGILKLYLRTLPEPLLTYHLYDQWMEAAVEPDHDTRLKALWSVVNSLPETHFKNLRYLIKFLSRLCQNSDLNKMSIQNVAIVIGPNLIWPPVEECALGMNMTATNLHSSIVDTLITYCDWFFPGECEFYVSAPTSPRRLDGIYGSQLSLSTTRLSNGGTDSALDSMSSSPANSSPKSPSPRVPVRPRKKAAPRAPEDLKNPLARSVSCSGFQASVLARAHAASLSVSHENLLSATQDDTGHNNHQHHNGQSQRELQLPAVERRPKPPRQSLPPVAERVRRSVVRPSLPPPERPDSVKSEESGSSVSPDPEILDPEDISISFDSSGSESFNECTMSFEESSDNEEDKTQCKVNDTSEEIESNRSYSYTEEVYSDCVSNIQNGDSSRHHNSETFESSLQMRKSCLVASNRINTNTLEDSLIDDEAKRKCIIVEDVDTRTVDETKRDSPSGGGGGLTKKPLRAHISWKDSNDGHYDHVSRELDYQECGLDHYDQYDLGIKDNGFLRKNGCSKPTNGNYGHKNSDTKPKNEDYGHKNGDSNLKNEDYGHKIVGSKPKNEDYGNGSNPKNGDQGHKNRDSITKDEDYSHKNGGYKLKNRDSNIKSRECIEEKDTQDPKSNNNVDEEYNSCHFTGGTPTWFDHYGIDDKRQSDTLWFRDKEEYLHQEDEDLQRSSLCSISEDSGSYRTVIDVGSENKISYRSTVSGMAIKLRVNSETQDTKL
ncbi:hypothetical protein JTE90_007904 [Oedothorax gibbosus]|uniref:Rho GTPase-activating protein 44 n=1 Tax=Oedothorax gibbosus TaxID=931172 RepID=A0AAV6VJF3_9ARAC|nr:hypothetical protein JTE90_007904 [Oedothorax gibbosus]